MTRDYKVSGMSCAACVARVEKAAGSVKGVDSVVVNLLTGDLRAEGEFDEEDIIAAVNAAGYRTALRSESGNTVKKQKEERKSDVRERLTRLIVSASLLVVLFVVSMSYSMNMPEFEGAAPRTVAVISGGIQLLLSLSVIIVNYKIFVSGFRSLIKLSPNMDSLVATGVAASFGYSAVLFCLALASADPSTRPVYYFESSAMILTFMGIGKLLEALAKGKANDAVSALKNLVPDRCTVIREGKELTVDTADVKAGETVLIRPGDRIALDGEIISGVSEIDESSVTGESIPVLKKAGDEAIAGTVNITGVITAKVSRVSGETTVDRMAELVSEIAMTKAPIAKIADRVAAVFVPAVMSISVIVLAGWLIAGRDISFALSNAVSVLVVSCPCALGLATPVAIICGSATAAGRGVLFKSSEALENCGRIKTVLFDKTGTITEGNMKVDSLIPAKGVTEEELLYASALCEYGGTHPIAKAIIAFAEGKTAGSYSFQDAERQFIPGQGVSARIGDNTWFCGKLSYVSGAGNAALEAASSEAGFSGSTVYVFKNSAYLGKIRITDVLTNDAKECMDALRSIHVETVMLTGDNENAARSIANEVGIDSFKAGLLPENKAEYVFEIGRQRNEKTAMVGDGINDAPALTAADVGIAIGRGTEIAIEAADVVITGSSLKQVSGALMLSKRTLRVIRENLFWAFGYNIIGIPLAAGLFSLINESFVLSPAFSSVCMSISSVLVVTNSLRLLAMGNRCFGKIEKLKNSPVNCDDTACGCSQNGNVCDIIDGENENKADPEGEKTMFTTTIEVKGMMCHNCERHVNNGIKAAFDVVSVESNHEKNLTVIVSNVKLDEEKLREVIKEEGYEPGKVTVE